MTLVEFIEARIAEDEAIARAAATVDRGMANPTRYRHEPCWSAYEDYDYEGGLSVGSFTTQEDANANLRTALDGALREETDQTRFIGRNDPARVLAECRAKRRIVAEFQENERLASIAPEVLAAEVRRTNLTLEGVLLYLALPYAEHPSYDPAWAPAE